MLLLIIVSSILVYADATPNYSINQIDELNYLMDHTSNIPEEDKIPAVDEKLFASTPSDAKLTAVSETVNFFF